MRSPCRGLEMLVGWLVAAVMLGCAGGAGAIENETPPPLTPQELRSLVRTGQLSLWFRDPLSQAQALCIQAEFGSQWPGDDVYPHDERDADKLRRAREKCVVTLPDTDTRTPAGADDELRFIAEWRADYLSRVRHLNAVKQVLCRCIAQDAQRTVDVTCMRRLVGQPLSPRELELLVLALPGKP